MPDRIVVEGLRADTVIGVYGWERMVRQELRIDLVLHCDLQQAGASDLVGHTVDYKTLTQDVRDRVESSRYHLIETLACDVAECCLSRERVTRVEVRVNKRGALRQADNVAVVVTRSRGEPSGRPPHRVYLGIGSNVDPVANVRTALAALHAEFGALRVSPVYRTVAVGSEGAPDFLNLAVELRTGLDLDALRVSLRELEARSGRVRGPDRNAPRTLDVDVLLYDDQVVADAVHPLPDPLVESAPFVLVPLADIAAPVVHPTRGVTIAALRAALPEHVPGVDPWEDEVLY
jgi:2-amino-4-hydroxy-6-hydroxymethyldihydropteridine diphosphokinase/dihydroneopterin aldolase